MVFKATFTELVAKRRRSGAVLADLLVGTALAGIVMLGMAALTTFSLRSFGAMANYVNLDQCSRNALDKMSKEIRQCNSLVAADYNYLWFQDSDGYNLLYYYIPSTQILYRLKDNGVTWVMDSKPLLTGCTYLNFGIYQRNPILGTYDQYPAATPTTCKLVQLTWICNRSLVNTWNTESVQSAKVVIRKE